jgi:hypothetical protein
LAALGPREPGQINRLHKLDVPEPGPHAPQRSKSGLKRRNLRAYAVEDEATVRLKDRRDLLLRPVIPTDVEGVCQIFHRLSVREVYTRFFRKRRGLTNQVVQRLRNLDQDNEVTLVAVTGTRKQPVICGHAMYDVDPSTYLAETDVIAHPDWQGRGRRRGRRLGIQPQSRSGAMLSAWSTSASRIAWPRSSASSASWSMRSR